MVPAHRPARIRRNDAASARAQRQLRLPDREKLHPVPASDHLAALRPADAAPLRRAQSRGAETGHRNRFDGHLALRYAERYGKYKKSFHHSRPQKGANRPAAQSELHLLDLHRGGVQPAGAVGRHVGGGESRHDAVQPLVYIRRFGIGKDPHRTIDRPRSVAASSRAASALRVDEQIPGPVPDGAQTRRNSRFHPLLSDDRRAHHRRHPGADRKAGYAERLLQHLQPPAPVGQAADPHVG